MQKTKCKVLSVSRSGYYIWLHKKPSLRAINNDNFDKEIIKIFIKNKRRYGCLRIAKELKANKNKIHRRMKKLGLKTHHKRKFKVTTDSKYNLPVAENILNRDFTTTGINQKWVSDISYVQTNEGWLYLAVMIDLYSRQVIGWALSKKIDKYLVASALKMALWRRKFPKGTIVHSDRGSQYCSNFYQNLLKNSRLICSMSRRGNCWDNAVTESFFHTLKVELIYNQKYKTRDEAEKSIFEYIEVYYNRERRHSAINYEIPVEFENKMNYFKRAGSVH